MVDTHQRQEGREERKSKKVKRWKIKRIEAQRAKPRTPTPATDALIGDEQKTGKRREQRIKRTRSGFTAQLPRNLRSPPTIRRDHAVSLFL